MVFFCIKRYKNEREAFAEIKKHPVTGKRIIEPIASLAEVIPKIGWIG